MSTVRLNIAFDELTWKRLRRIAEAQRAGGRTSVSAVVRRAVDKLFQGANGEGQGDV